MFSHDKKETPNFTHLQSWKLKSWSPFALLRMTKCMCTSSLTKPPPAGDQKRQSCSDRHEICIHITRGAELFKSVASSKCSQNIVSPSRRAAKPMVLPGDQDWLQETQSFSSGGPFSVWEEKETSHSFTVCKRPASFMRQVNKFSLH